MAKAVAYLVAIAILQITPSALIQGQPKVHEESTCTDMDGNAIDMGEIRITLSNRRIIGDRHYTISGNNVIISDTPHQREGVLIYDAIFLISGQSRNGLVLFHADLRQTPYIYWIDKNPSDLSRNGLLRIVGEDIAPACEGNIHR